MTVDELVLIYRALIVTISRERATILFNNLVKSLDRLELRIKTLV